MFYAGLNPVASTYMDNISHLPSRFSDAAYLRGAYAIKGRMDLSGVGSITTEEMFTEVEIPCQWEPYIAESGVVVVYFTVRSNDKFLVLCKKGFLDNIEVV